MLLLALVVPPNYDGLCSWRSENFGPGNGLYHYATAVYLNPSWSRSLLCCIITVTRDQNLQQTRIFNCQRWIHYLIFFILFHIQHRQLFISRAIHIQCYMMPASRDFLSPVNSPHNGQWPGALLFSLVCAWTNDWINNWDASDLRRIVLIMTSL